MWCPEQVMSMLTRAGRILVMTTILLTARNVAVGETPAEPAPRVDTGIRLLIEQAVGAIVRNDKDLPERLDALRDPGIGDRRTVLLQIALYLANSTGTEQSMSGAAIVHQLAFTPTEKLETILPHMDGASPQLLHVFTELLSTIDRPEGGSPDFSFYETWIGKANHSPPSRFIRYLYEVSPEVALASMERVYGVGPGQSDTSKKNLDQLRRLIALRESGASWSDHDRARVVTTLESISTDSAWWRRLYAATILARNPDLASPEMTKRLKTDPNPIVSGTVFR